MMFLCTLGLQRLGPSEDDLNHDSGVVKTAETGIGGMSEEMLSVKMENQDRESDVMIFHLDKTLV